MQTAARRLAFSSSSASPSKRVFIGLIQSNFRTWRKPYATSVSPILFRRQRGKRISKEERRVLVESFVDKYKATNEGKIPHTSHVRQQIGGSYYVIRQILQELQYNTKLASLGKGIESRREAEDTFQDSNAKELFSLSIGDEIVQNSDAKGLSSVSVGDEIDTVQKSDAKGFCTIFPENEIDAVQNSDTKILSTISGSSYDALCREVVQHKRDDKTLESGEHQHPIDYQSSEQGEAVDGRKEMTDANSSNASHEEVFQHTGYDKALESGEHQHLIDYQSSFQGETVECRKEMATADSTYDALCGEVVQHKGDDKALESEHQRPIDYHSSEQGDSPKTTNLWSALRSFADGVIGFWRKK